MLFFGSETWVLTEAMLQNIEAVHVGFLRQVTGIKARRFVDKTCQKGGTERVLQAEGTKLLQEYIKKREVAIEEWVALWPIFEVCAKGTGYKGGGRLREPWWEQAAAEQQLKSTLKDILT